MTAEFYHTSSDPLEYTKLVDTIESAVTLHYVEDTELEEPTFILDSDAFNDKVNFIYVGNPINRFYFVDGVTFSQGRCFMKCSEDYLSSWRNQINKLTGIVERVSTNKRWNLYLQDDMVKTFNMTRFCTIPWPGGFRVNGSKTYSYILTLSGGGSNGNNNNP